MLSLKKLFLFDSVQPIFQGYNTSSFHVCNFERGRYQLS